MSAQRRRLSARARRSLSCGPGRLFLARSLRTRAINPTEPRVCLLYEITRLRLPGLFATLVEIPSISWIFAESLRNLEPSAWFWKFIDDCKKRVLFFFFLFRTEEARTCSTVDSLVVVLAESTQFTELNLLNLLASGPLILCTPNIFYGTINRQLQQTSTTRFFVPKVVNFVSINVVYIFHIFLFFKFPKELLLPSNYTWDAK